MYNPLHRIGKCIPCFAKPIIFDFWQFSKRPPTTAAAYVLGLGTHDIFVFHFLELFKLFFVMETFKVIGTKIFTCACIFRCRHTIPELCPDWVATTVSPPSSESR
uniref:Uncharacterized protein n=1 Tax=Octactis speculum TaxID=3111310 RepID=A0A7S2CWA7_9STRA